MATSKPRITITLEPHAHEVLARLSALNKESMSSLVSGLLDVALPSLERTVAMLERIVAAPGETKAGLAASLARAESQLGVIAQELLRQQDLTFEDVDQKVRASVVRDGRRPARKAPGQGSTPVPVTRGSGGPKTPAKAAKQPAKKGARRA